MATTLQSEVSSKPDRSAMPAIRLEDLSHNYGQRAALKSVSFEIREGEIFALLGPNGSGKTTLFRILSTLMLPSSGRALISGFDPAKQPDQVRRCIGVVFQARSVDIKLTAAENLWHQGHLYGLRGSPLKARIQHMLERVGLSDRAGDRVETLSGGMQRRVELAKGLIHRPAVLLLDEPTTGLDPGARRDLWQYLQELRAHEGVSIIVTTHLMEEAERCDRLAILNLGQVVALGSPAELRSQIGGDVIMLGTGDARSLALDIQQEFRIPCSVLDGKVRLERKDGHRFVTELIEAFPGKIDSISVSKPNLEDVFIARTGHRLWSEAEPGEND
jgi:ABC-2 type transport system ATP-binding protein